MLYYIFTHLDGILLTGGGIVGTVFTIILRNDLKNSENKYIRSLPNLAPLLIIAGVLLLFVDKTPIPDWQRVYTEDGTASVNFPANPTLNSPLTQGGVRSTYHILIMAGGNVELALIQAEYPPQWSPIPPEEVYQLQKDALVSQGLTIEDESQYSDTIWDLALVNPKEKQRLVMRIAITPTGMYRAMATAREGHHDDPRIETFIYSFESNPASVPQPAPAPRQPVPE